MADWAIKVEELGKRFELGMLRADAVSLVTQLGMLTRPWQWRHRRRARKTIWALRDVSFVIEQGEIVGVIGGNGAGKSTLLKVLSRITSPTRGRAELIGSVSSLLEVGTGFHGELTGRENIFLNGAILGMSRKDIVARFDKIVEFSGLHAFLDTPVKRYSSGMYVRLAFAVAAHLDPDVLLVDEVLAVGDAEFQKKCLGVMDEAAEHGRTILFVSHNMSAVQRLCPRSIWLDHGQIREIGPTEAVVAAYLGEHTKPGLAGVELADRSRVGDWGQRIRLTRCELLNSAGNPSCEMAFGESFSVWVQASAPSTIDGISVVVGIDSEQQQRIATSASETQHALYRAGPAAPLVAKATFPDLRLNPGRYSITLGLRSGRRGLDQVVAAVQMTVTELAHNTGDTAAGVWGFLSPTVKWGI